MGGVHPVSPLWMHTVILEDGAQWLCDLAVCLLFYYSYLLII